MVAQTVAREHCPGCGQFIPVDPDGFFDRLNRADETSYVVAFCTEQCADDYHTRKRSLRVHGVATLCTECAAAVKADES